MTLVTKPVGRIPGYPANPQYDSQTAYGRKQRCIQYGCELESLVDNNTYTPFAWDGDKTFTLDDAHWRLISGNPEVWAAGNPKPATTGTTGDYPYNGMGRVVLAKNMVNNVNTLTQDMFYKGEVGSRVPNTNTIFVIQYDFDLNGQTIDVPSNSIIEFAGGSLNNGMFRFNGAMVIGNPKGDALYGVAYKDGKPLSHNYKRISPISQATDHAFATGVSNGVSSPLRISMGSQSVCVTDEYVFVFGYDWQEGEYQDTGLIVLFDRNFNYLGQARASEIGHAQGACVVGNYILTVDTWYSRGKINYIPISSIISACQSNGTVSGITSQTVSQIDLALGIAYDDSNNEVAIINAHQNEHSVEAYLQVYSYDSVNNTVIYKTQYATDIHDYIQTNLIGGAGQFADKDYRGVVTNMTYKHGVIYTLFWDNAGQDNYDGAFDGKSTGYLIMIDGCNGIPVANLGELYCQNPCIEPEGLCFDPQDDEILWTLTISNLYYNSEYPRQGVSYINRISIVKKVTSDVLANINEPDGSGFSALYDGVVYIDNTYTGFSVGDKHAPFKTFDAAFILAMGRNRVKYIFKESNNEYNLGFVNVAVPKMTFEGTDDITKVKLKGQIKVADNCHFVLSYLTFNSYGENFAINSFFSTIELTNVSMVNHASGSSADPTSVVGGVAVDVNSSRIRINGSCEFKGYNTCVLLERGSVVEKVFNIDASYINKVFEVADADTPLPDCIGNITVPSGKFILKKEVPVIYDNRNLLVGTANITEIGNSDTPTTDNAKWRQAGGNPAPSIINANVSGYQQIQKGLNFAGNNTAMFAVKEFKGSANGGYVTISFLAKGTGSLNVGLSYVVGGNRRELWFSRDMNDSAWTPVVFTAFIKEIDLSGNLYLTIGLWDGYGSYDYDLCAFKVEMNDRATGWCPNGLDTNL